MADQIHPPAAAPTRGRLSRRAVLGAGGVLLAAGLSGSGYVVWEMFFNPLMDEEAADQAISDLKAEWSRPTMTAQVVPGNAVALLRIPDFGNAFQVPVIRGTDNASLAKGVGWFNGTAAPGQVGNFAVAGHRGAHGPFVKLPDLQPDARVEVETRDAIYIYALDNHPADTVVLNDATWVLDPVPGKPPATTPDLARITLVTCAELFHAPQRAVAFGHLVETRPKPS